VELVELEFAAVDERWIGRGLARVCCTKLSSMGESQSLAGVNIGGIGVMRCTPAMSVSSVTSEGYRSDGSMSPPSEFQRNLRIRPELA
jgi:hypothetical protein